MAKTLVNLSLSEAKTSVSLSLESKGNDPTWDTHGGTWDEAADTWANPRATTTKEAKTKADLTLE